MGRFGGFGSAAGSRRVVHLAVAAAAVSALMTASALADTSSTTKKSTKHSSSHHTSSSSAAATASAKPGDTCKPTPDQAGIGIRALQTELMVAGLKCSAEQWNTFTAKFKATLKTDADRLQKAFAKAYGKGGSNQMNAFVTSLANEASQRSNHFSEADYCKQQDVLFTKVLALTEKELERFSVGRKLNVDAPVALCAPDPEEGAAVTTTAAAVAPGAAPATSGATATVAVSSNTTPAATPVSAKR